MLFDKQDDALSMDDAVLVEKDVFFADASEEEVFSENKFVKGTVVGGNLNLRVAPEMTAAIVDVLPNGATVEAVVTELGKEWASVSANGLSGFVKSQFIKWNEE